MRQRFFFFFANIASGGVSEKKKTSRFSFGFLIQQFSTASLYRVGHKRKILGFSAVI